MEMKASIKSIWIKEFDSRILRLSIKLFLLLWQQEFMEKNSVC